MKSDDRDAIAAVSELIAEVRGRANGWLTLAPNPELYYTARGL